MNIQLNADIDFCIKTKTKQEKQQIALTICNGNMEYVVGN